MFVAVAIGIAIEIVFQTRGTEAIWTEYVEISSRSFQKWLMK